MGVLHPLNSPAWVIKPEIDFRDPILFLFCLFVSQESKKKIYKHRKIYSKMSLAFFFPFLIALSLSPSRSFSLSPPLSLSLPIEWPHARQCAVSSS